MGNRVYAEFIVAPWQPESLKRSEEGRNLLDALKNYGFSDEYEEYDEEHGIPVKCFIDHEANYGSAAFVENGLVRLAQEAGVWVKIWDSGDGIEWGPDMEIYAPNGNSWEWATDVDREPMFSARQIEGLLLEDPSGDLLRKHIALAQRSLSQWITLEQTAGDSAR